HPDVMVWPEAAVPGYLRYDPALQKLISGFARQHHLWIVLGADDAEPKAGNPNEADYFNSSFLIDPQGNLVDRYSKQRLVIFGEYIPLVRWLPFLKHLTTIDGGFTPGKGPVTFSLKNPDVRLSVLICFEDVFGHGARTHAGQDVDFLLNLTNDGWFGEGAEQWQHAAIAVYRAVENGLPLVRCTNNGLTCWIDPVGRLLGVPEGDRSLVYRSGFHIVNLPVPVVSGQRQRTFYNRHGDVFGWVCVAVTAWAFAGWWRWRKALKKS
ncbi:MAG TPA: apolipoprotein N-acyltransferase, partial [Roseimicrobium sp.]|nr:apolipoprotein N-acyltransferase [Roseimicrobium sp.]